jgi:deoxyribonuclease V
MDLLTPPKLDLERLAELQRRIAKAVIAEDRFGRIERVAGCDVSGDDEAWAACVVLDYRTLDVVEKRVERVRLRFPYIPTFLAFRELEGLLSVAGKVKADLFMVGAHGIAHPRRAGLASHLGVVMDSPTIGVAKSLICGRAELPANRRGAYTLVVDGKEVIGAAVRTVAGVKPVYVSAGHRVSLKTAIEVVLRTSSGYRLPEPLRIAHMAAASASRS